MSRTKEKVLLQICKKKNTYLLFLKKHKYLEIHLKVLIYSKSYKINTSNRTKKKLPEI